MRRNSWVLCRRNSFFPEELVRAAVCHFANPFNPSSVSVIFCKVSRERSKGPLGGKERDSRDRIALEKLLAGLADSPLS